MTTGCSVCGKDCEYLTLREKCCHCESIPKCHYCEKCEEEHFIDKSDCKDDE